MSKKKITAVFEVDDNVLIIKRTLDMITSNNGIIINEKQNELRREN